MNNNFSEVVVFAEDTQSRLYGNSYGTFDDADTAIEFAKTVQGPVSVVGYIPTPCDTVCIPQTLYKNGC